MTIEVQLQLIRGNKKLNILHHKGIVRQTCHKTYTYQIIYDFF